MFIAHSALSTTRNRMPCHVPLPVSSRQVKTKEITFDLSPLPAQIEAHSGLSTFARNDNSRPNSFPSPSWILYSFRVFPTNESDPYQ